MAAVENWKNIHFGTRADGAVSLFGTVFKSQEHVFHTITSKDTGGFNNRRKSSDERIECSYFRVKQQNATRTGMSRQSVDIKNIMDTHIFTVRHMPIHLFADTHNIYIYIYF